MLPVLPFTAPSDIRAYENGKIPTPPLIEVRSVSGRVDKIHPLAWRSFLPMRAACLAHTGLLLDWTPGGAYRTYASQAVEFRRRYRQLTPTEKVVKGDKWWEGAWWRLRPGFAPLSTPGSSKHSLGVAFDFAHWVDGAYVGIKDKAVGWLIANAHKFGFSAEIQSEKWHWRYVAGDAIPAMTLAWEAATPAPIEREDDVNLVAIGAACTRQGNGRMAHYRAERLASGAWRVYAWNGAPLANVTGQVFGVSYFDCPDQGEVEFLGLEPAPDHGGVVAVFGQGITVDVR